MALALWLAAVVACAGPGGTAIDAGTGDARPPTIGGDANVDADAAAPDVADAAPPDAGVPDPGTPGRGLAAGGRRSSSSRFVLFSITGQPTPVGAGPAGSPRFVHQPGILGGKS